MPTDKVEADKIAADKVQIRAELGLSNVNAIAEAGAAADRAEAARDTAISETQKAIDANSKAQQAKTIATQQAATATTQADKAKASADKATAVSGMDRVEQVVDSALTEKYLWSRNRADFDAMRNEVESTRAGSGWDEWGKHFIADYGYDAINEGLCTDPGRPNYLRLGRDDGGAGVSRTKEPVINCDGVKFHISKMAGDVDYSESILKLPPPADGTQVTDSSGNVRGSGKPKLDLKVDVDPKYGDVAFDKKEAQSRAFEGLLKNGDFRNDTTDWEVNSEGRGSFVVTEGLATITDTTGRDPSAGSMYITQFGDTYKKGVTYRVEVVITESTKITECSVRLGLFNEHVFNPVKLGSNVFEFTPSTDFTGSAVLIYAGKLAVLKVASVSSKPVAESVITSRQDLSFIESWYEVIGTGSGEKDIYCPLGLPQYGATSYLGITLSDLGSLGVGLGYAKFGEWQEDGDVVAKGMKWSTLSLDNKKKVIDADPNMFYDETRQKPVCVRVRGRTVEGFNDNWDAKYKAANQYDRITCTSFNSVRARGKLTDAVDFTKVGDNNDSDNYSISPTGKIMNSYYSNANTYHAGQWRSRRKPSTIGDGSGVACIPLAITQRLNDGAWHPSYNPWGTALFEVNGVEKKFHELTKAQQPKSQLDCFLMTKAGTGLISSGKTGRYDQYKYCDSIYAGMVHDARLTSRKQNISKLRVDSKNKDVEGTKRGKGKVPFTNVYIANVNADLQGTDGTRIYLQFPKGTLRASTDDVRGGGNLIDGNGDVYECSYFRTDDPSVDYVYLNPKHNGSTLNLTGIRGSGFVYLSPEFDSLPFVNIIGDTANVATVFPDGCIGVCIDKVPDGVNTDYELTRKSNVSSTARLYTKDNGDTWVSTTRSINTETNNLDLPVDAVNVELHIYESLAKSTKPSPNGKIVGEVSNDVYASSDYRVERGNRIGESLSGVICKSKNTHPTYSDYKINKVCFAAAANRILVESQQYPTTHKVIDLGKPINDSQAVKFVHNITEIDGLLYDIYHGSTAGFSNDAGTPTEVKVDTSYSYENGKVYLLNHAAFGVLNGTYWQFKADTSADAAAVLLALGKYLNHPLAEAAMARKWGGSGWGDNGQVPIGDNESMFTDWNGDTQKAFCHVGLSPIGIANYNDSSQSEE